MFTKISAFRQSQLNWIHAHPVQYVALNATLLAVIMVTTELKDRRDQKSLENETALTA